MWAFIGALLLIVFAAWAGFPAYMLYSRWMKIGSSWGVRTTATLATADIWLESHRRARPFFWLAEILALLNAFAVAGLTFNLNWKLQLGAVVIGFLLPVAARVLGQKVVANTAQKLSAAESAS